MDNDNNIYKTRETLLAKIKSKHDDASWEDFVFYYKDFIYIVCRRLNLSHHDSEEIVQKVLLFLWGALPEFEYDKKQKFRGWLFQVTKNTVRDFYKHIKRQNTKVENASKSSLQESSSMPDIDEIAEKEWKAYIANMALDNIKDKFSETVIEVFRMLSQGKSRSCVAEEMDLPPNTVSVYKKRVTAMMHKEIRRLNVELGEI
jgi:RNA polymerase sigma factor (sigma-70 family)